MSLVRGRTNDVNLRDLPTSRINSDIDTNAFNMDTTEDEESQPVIVNNQPENDSSFTLPSWLMSNAPLRSSVLSDLMNLPEKQRSRMITDKCLFYPLKMCTDYVINGFCTWHLRGIFNLTVENESILSYDNLTRSNIISSRKRAFIKDPRPYNDESLLLFPFPEALSSPIKRENMVMRHFQEFLQREKVRNCDSVYSSHIVYLYKIFTLSTCNTEANNDHRYANIISTISLHFQNWNRYQSIHLERPVIMRLFLPISNLRSNIKVYNVENLTTISQMVLRLFDLGYCRSNDERIQCVPCNFSISPEYAHFTMNNNLCPLGTTTAKTSDGRHVNVLGTPARFLMLRIDDIGGDTLHCIKTHNDYTKDELCVSTTIEPTDPVFNDVVAVPFNSIC